MNSPKYYVQKFSNDTMLIESVLIAGVPKFLVARNGSITIEDQSVFPDKVLKPLEPLSYVNKPHSFESAVEVDACIKIGQLSMSATCFGIPSV